MLAQEGFQGKLNYTGNLRAVYPIIPIPKRFLDQSIQRPDYALHR